MRTQPSTSNVAPRLRGDTAAPSRAGAGGSADGASATGTYGMSAQKADPDPSCTFGW